MVLFLSKNPVFFKATMGIFAFSIVVALSYFEAKIMQLREKTSAPL